MGHGFRERPILWMTLKFYLYRSVQSIFSWSLLITGALFKANNWLFNPHNGFRYFVIEFADAIFAEFFFFLFINFVLTSPTYLLCMLYHGKSQEAIANEKYSQNNV